MQKDVGAVAGQDVVLDFTRGRRVRKEQLNSLMNDSNSIE
jgi:hypothetical protein